MKFLLVDDEPFALRLVTHQLGRLGFHDVRAMEDPAAALAVIEGDAGVCDMILLDLQMPGIDGVEFVRHLATVGYAGGLILISGEDERILQTAFKLAKAQSLDVRGALHKPVTPAQLQALLVEPMVPAAAARRRSARKLYSAERVAQAIADGEIVNHYQPQLLMSTGEIDGVESLARWQHPEDGLVFPDQFIPVAEEHGLIAGLTNAVILDGLRQTREWRDVGLRIRMSINVSMESLSALQFPDFVAKAIAAAGVPPESLVLEVTESRLAKDALASLDIVTRLRLKHVGLSIDDFGTGNSSLAQLRDMPFDELKIDQGFVRGATHDPAKRAIVEANLSLARQLGLRTVAEGVEEREDWDLLRSLGCDVAQGWFMAKAMPADALPAWITQWEQRRAELVPGRARGRAS